MRKLRYVLKPFSKSWTITIICNNSISHLDAKLLNLEKQNLLKMHTIKCQIHAYALTNISMSILRFSAMSTDIKM